MSIYRKYMINPYFYVLIFMIELNINTICLEQRGSAIRIIICLDTHFKNII